MTQTHLLPDADTMYRAFVERDASFEGLFVTGVRTTGIFCRPTCPARKPNRENTEFFPRPCDAISAGYRPCLRCRPMEPRGETPEWLRPVLREIDRNPMRRWTAAELREFGVDPVRARRWFQAVHGMTFMAYLRARRLGQAFSRLQEGAGVLEASLDADFDSVSGFTEAIRRGTGRTPGQAAGRKVLHLAQTTSPLGPIVIAGDEEAVYLVEFQDRRMLEGQFNTLENRLGAVVFPGETGPIKRMRDELAAYFAGERQRFETPLRFPGSEHQVAVWTALLGIPFGQTCSYGDLAVNLGKPSATRAVARAVGENRLAIVIPCHRVVGADGKLTGYGGGLWRKRYLLDLERAAVSR